MRRSLLVRVVSLAPACGMGVPGDSLRTHTFTDGAAGQPEALCGIGINFRADRTGALLVSSLIEGGQYNIY